MRSKMVIDRINEKKMKLDKIKNSDRTLIGATLEMEVLSQCGESTLSYFKQSPTNHQKISVVRQLVPVE